MHSKVDYIVAHGISTYIGDNKIIIGSYHFVFEDESCFDARRALSLKEAVLEASEYTGYNSELFRKALKGFDESDVRGIVDIYNHFTKDPDYNIKTVMLVSSVLYEELE